MTRSNRGVRGPRALARQRRLERLARSAGMAIFGCALASQLAALPRQTEAADAVATDAAATAETSARASGSPSDGWSADERFQEGNRRYQAGDFEGAIAAYTEILDAGLESGDLHYNVGNAHFKIGELGRAILHYERAREALPGDETVQANLDLARSLTADRITPLPEFWGTQVVRWWVNLLPRGLLIALVAFSYVALAGALGAHMLARRPRPWVRRVAVFAGIVAVLFGLNLVARELGIGRAERGVVLVTEAPVQSAPSDDPSLRLFTIHEGAVVRIDRRSNEWLEVVLEDGKVGWLVAESVETI